MKIEDFLVLAKHHMPAYSQQIDKYLNPDGVYTAYLLQVTKPNFPTLLVSKTHRDPKLVLADRQVSMPSDYYCLYITKKELITGVDVHFMRDGNLYLKKDTSVAYEEKVIYSSSKRINELQPETIMPEEWMRQFVFDYNLGMPSTWFTPQIMFDMPKKIKN